MHTATRPTQVIAARPYTYASDIWSLGCVLYEMAARRTAFESVGLPQLMFKIIRTAYEPLPMVFSRPFQQLVCVWVLAAAHHSDGTTVGQS